MQEREFIYPDFNHTGIYSIKLKPWISQHGWEKPLECEELDFQPGEHDPKEYEYIAICLEVDQCFAEESGLPFTLLSEIQHIFFVRMEHIKWNFQELIFKLPSHISVRSPPTVLLLA